MCGRMYDMAQIVNQHGVLCEKEREIDDDDAQNSCIVVVVVD